MRENTIKITPFEFINILDLQIEKQVNEHITARIVGTISPDNEDRYVESAASSRNMVIAAQDNNGAEKILFSGLVNDVSIQYVNELRTLVVSAISYSYLMDIKKITRTYQNRKMTYEAVTDIMAKDNSDFAFLQPQYGSNAIGSMFVQYEETNWQFAKRIASRLNTCIVSDYMLDMPYVSIGMPSRDSESSIYPVEYSIKKDVSEYLDLKAHKVRDMTERNAMYYEVKSREIFELCDMVMFKDRQLYVYSISSRLDGAVILHTYTLKEKEGFCFKEFFNEKIIGASLYGTVRAIENDVVQVNIDNDVRQSKYKWFLYSTVYSSPDGTGWYFMPEEGDTIRLHFPTEHENDSYVISSVHQQHANRSDPDIKHITTKYGKTVVFRPDSIYISNGAGSSIELNDKNGIRVNTSKEINISAAKNINVHGSSKVIVQGDKGVTVLQNGSQIHIDENIDLASGHVRIR